MAAWQTHLGKEIRELVAVAAEADAFLTRHDVPPGPRFKVRLAVEELVRNLIDHTPQSPDLRIDLRLEAHADHLEIAVEDDGPPFDLCQAPAFDRSAPLANRSGKGMGIHLVRHFIHEIHQERRNGRNCLRLVVRDEAKHVP